MVLRHDVRLESDEGDPDSLHARYGVLEQVRPGRQASQAEPDLALDAAARAQPVGRQGRTGHRLGVTRVGRVEQPEAARVVPDALRTNRTQIWSWSAPLVPPLRGGGWPLRVGHERGALAR